MYFFTVIISFDFFGLIYIHFELINWVTIISCLFKNVLNILRLVKTSMSAVIVSLKENLIERRQLIFIPLLIFVQPFHFVELWRDPSTKLVKQSPYGVIERKKEEKNIVPGKFFIYYHIYFQSVKPSFSKYVENSLF